MLSSTVTDDQTVTHSAADIETAGATRRIPRPPTVAGVIAMWRQHQDLLRNAITLAATTGVTSVLGFGYWAVAARLFGQQAVGYGATAVSAMTLLGTIGMLGMGTLLIGELPRRRARAGLVSAALLTCGIGSLVLGLGFAVLAPHFSSRFGHVSGSLSQAALFAAGVILTGTSLVLDQATIGLLRGGLQLTRNVIFAVVKVLALPAAAITFHDQFGFGITASWVAGIAVSLAVLAIGLRFSGTPVLPRPDFGVLRRLGRTALAHNWLNLAISIPYSLIPVLVTVTVSPSANAAFYAAWMVSGFLKIVPTHLSTVLFAIAAADPQVIARKLRFTVRISLLIGLPVMIVLAVGAHLILSLFGPSYALAATLPLQLLVLSYLPTIPKMQYIAVCRAAGRIPRAAAVMTAAAAAEVAAATVGGTLGGLKGLSFALLGVYVIEGLATTPAVIRAAIGHGRHRHSASPGVSADYLADAAMTRGQRPAGSGAGHEPAAGVGRSPRVQARSSLELAELSKRARQEAGLATLMLIARGQTAQLRPDSEDAGRMS
jgi:O-antigen/teichoic acid export membrane protein